MKNYKMLLAKLTRRQFSMSTIPLCDVSTFIAEKIKLPKSFSKSDLSPTVQMQCKEVAEALHEYGSLAIRDLRAYPSDNEKFLDLMEEYFIKRSKEFYQHNDLYKLTDCFPQHGFETGVTPEYIEKARDHSRFLSSLSEENKAETPVQIPKDAKWRYMYFIGKERGDINELAPDAHVPSDFPEFKERLNIWGNSLLNGAETVAEMASLGLGFESDYFLKMLNGGQHLLAPTGSDLQKHSKGTIFASFHYDFNFLTIHGKSRYPGLFIWLRDGTKIPVVMPDDYLLLQSGRQFEMLTGGYIQCGFHEVVYSEATQQKYNSLKETKGGNQWRVSSTLFSHVKHDVVLEPQGKFRTEETIKKYLPMTSYELLEEELKAINLHPTKN